VLTDTYGRKVTNLRMSLTQRCNFRCIYCHAEGERSPRDELPLDDIREILGQPYEKFIHPRDLPRVRENYQLRMQGQVVDQLDDTLMVRKDGSFILQWPSSGMGSRLDAPTGWR
jgi:pyruvate-formate lyase-activating enzyme